MKRIAVSLLNTLSRDTKICLKNKAMSCRTSYGSGDAINKKKQKCRILFYPSILLTQMSYPVVNINAPPSLIALTTCCKPCKIVSTVEALLPDTLIRQQTDLAVWTCATFSWSGDLNSVKRGPPMSQIWSGSVTDKKMEKTTGASLLTNLGVFYHVT